MGIQVSSLIRDEKGRPIPPTDLLARIKQYDDRLGLFYNNMGWAITETWRLSDPRWAMVQSGDLGGDFTFDICGYLPLTCSLDEAPAYITRELRAWTPDRFQSLRETVNHWNDVVQPAAQRDEALARVEDVMCSKDSPLKADPNSAPVAVDLVDNTVTPIAPKIDRAQKARETLAIKRQQKASA